MNCMFVAACHDKITCCEKKLKFFFFDFFKRTYLQCYSSMPTIKDQSHDEEKRQNAYIRIGWETCKKEDSL
jgi:hypothetical protein